MSSVICEYCGRQYRQAGECKCSEQAANLYKLDEFQATDDEQQVLFARFNDDGEPLWVKELRPAEALRLARELAQAAVTIRPLSDAVVQEVKDYLAMMQEIRL